MSFNHRLAKAAHEFKFEDLGFKYIKLEEDPRSNYWEYVGDNNFYINIDAWYEVILCHIDRDHLKLAIDDEIDLQAAIDFITEE